MRKLFCLIASAALAVCMVGCGASSEEKSQYLKVLDVMGAFKETIRSVAGFDGDSYSLKKVAIRMGELREEVDERYHPLIDRMKWLSEDVYEKMPRCVAGAKENAAQAVAMAKKSPLIPPKEAEELYGEYLGDIYAGYGACWRYSGKIIDAEIEFAKQFNDGVFDKEGDNSLFGVALGQVIDFDDDDERVNYGIHNIKRSDEFDGRKCVRFDFVPAKKFLSYNTYTIRVDAQSKEVFYIGASQDPFGEEKFEEINRTRDETWKALTSRYNGVEKKKDFHGASFWDIFVGKNVRVGLVVTTADCHLQDVVVGDARFFVAITFALVDYRAQNKDVDAL